MDESVRATLHGIQQRLFVVAAELASDAKGREILDNTVSAADVAELESLIDMCLEVTGPQRQFVIPGRDVPSAALHRARTVTRRAERRVLTMAETIPVRPELVTYLNRLSDTLYALARLTEHHHDLVVIEQVVRRSVAKALGSATDAPATYDLATLKLMAEAAEAGRRSGRADRIRGVDAGAQPHAAPDGRLLLGSIDIAIGKAFTSAAFNCPPRHSRTPPPRTATCRHPELQRRPGRRLRRRLPVFVDGLIAGGIASPVARSTRTSASSSTHSP